jgi:hypothetical protein
MDLSGMEEIQDGGEIGKPHFSGGERHFALWIWALSSGNERGS